MVEDNGMSMLRKTIDEASGLLQRGRRDEALSVLRKCIDSAAQQVKACKAAVGLLQEYGLWNESLALLDKTLNSHREDPELWFLKGNALDALYPEPPSVQGGEAWNALLLAVDCFKESLGIEPAFALAWFHKALVEEKLGRHNDAMTSYERFIGANPGPDLKAQAVHARQRLSERSIRAVPPAGDLSTGQKTWIERLADGDSADAGEFLKMAGNLKSSKPAGKGAAASAKTDDAASVSEEGSATPSGQSDDLPGKRGGGSPLFIPFEVILLLLSLPVLVPSLIVTFLMAKRWGRIDFVVLAVDGFIILLFALRSTAATVIVLTALAASAVLFIVRYRKLPYGIFLGYSNLVAMLLMGGGLLFSIGFWQFIPWTPLNELTSALGSEKIVSAEALVRHPVAYNSFVSLKNETVEWDKKLFRIIDGDGYKFSPYKSGGGIVVTNPYELWERKNDLAGQMVTLQGASLSPEAFEGTELEYSMKVDGVKEKDYSKRMFHIVPEAKGRLWIVTKPNETRLSAAPSGDGYQGVLAITYSNASMGRWYSSRFAGNLPYMGVTLLPERSVSSETKKPQRLETWVPVKGTERTLWIAYSGDATVTPPSSMKGVYKSNMGPVNGLREALPDLSYFQGPLQQPLVIMAAASRQQYIRENDLVGAFMRGIKWSALGMIIPGFIVIGAALFISSRE